MSACNKSHNTTNVVCFSFLCDLLEEKREKDREDRPDGDLVSD